jgi:hypothetical protein
MMTKEDIIRMAHEVGLHLATEVHWMPIIDLSYAERFANLVAAAERETCARMVDPVDESLADEIRARGEK